MLYRGFISRLGWRRLTRPSLLLICISRRHGRRTHIPLLTSSGSARGARLSLRFTRRRRIGMPASLQAGDIVAKRMLSAFDMTNGSQQSDIFSPAPLPHRYVGSPPQHDGDILRGSAASAPLSPGRRYDGLNAILSYSERFTLRPGRRHED